MSKLKVCLNYTGAVIVFFIGYLICAYIVSVISRIVNISEQGFWLRTVPYYTAFVTGFTAVFGGLYAKDYLFPAVRSRKMAWVFIGLLGVLWGLPLLGLLLSFIGIIDASPHNHILWSVDKIPLAIQTITGIIVFWKVTAKGGEWES